MNNILEVKNLKKNFKKADGSLYTAVNGISFELKTGEIFSFLGPNGAGKSTTINMLTTQLTPSSGEIKIEGKNIQDNTIFAKQKIGIVAQHNNLDRGLTAYENLIYHGKYFGMSTIEAEKKSLSLLKDFGLLEWKNDYVKSFSGGMAQRLKIARAIMHSPNLLFLDEPTTGLGPAYREILWEHVLRLNKEENTTVFLTTHYMEEPERFSDRVAIYKQGEIKALGTIEELRSLVPSNKIVYLTLNEIPEEMVVNLNKQKSIKEVKKRDEKNIIIYPSDEKQVLNDVITVVENSHLLLENIKLSTATLDDIFIHLTNDNTKGE